MKDRQSPYLRFHQDSPLHTARPTPPANEPAIHVLAGKNLPAVETSLAQKSILSREEIDFTLDLVWKEGVANSLWTTIQKKIRASAANTNMPHPFQHSDAVEKLKSTNIQVGNEKKQLGKAVGVTYGLMQRMPTSEGAQLAGVYVIAQQQILIARPQPNVVDNIEALAKTGQEHAVTKTDNHEWVHAAQFLLGHTAIARELVEVHAHRRSGHAVSDYIYFKSDMCASKSYSSLSSQKIDAAIWAIDRMTSLGYSDEQIIQAMSISGDWYPDLHIWEGLEAQITYAQKLQGLTTKDLEKLVEKAFMLQRIAIQQARLITQQTLYEAFRVQLEERRRQRFPQTLSV